MVFTNEQRELFRIPPGWREPKIRCDATSFIQPINPMVPHLNRPGDKRPETRAYVVHGTGNLNPGAGARANGDYFRRKYQPGPYLVYDEENKVWVRKEGYIEFGSLGRGRGGLGNKFSVASTHNICDRHCVEVTIPYQERSLNCGDRNIKPWTEKYRGMPPLALELFGARDPSDGKMKPYPNSYTYSLEIAMNDTIPGSSVDWEETCMTARWYMARVAIEHGDDLTKIPILRHFDVTAKECPSPFVGPPSEETAWIRFHDAAIALYKFMRGL